MFSPLYLFLIFFNKNLCFKGIIDERGRYRLFFFAFFVVVVLKQFDE